MRRRLITLHRARVEGVNVELLVNPDYIARVRPMLEGSEVLVSGTSIGELWHVTETAKEIERLSNQEL